MKQTLLILFLLFPFLSKGQLQENFSDGNFTQNPTWTGNTGSFLVNTAGQLQSNGPAVTGTTLTLSTSLEAVTGTVWEFWANLRLATSSGNYADIFLISDSEDLSGSNSGYFVRIGGTPDEVSLFRKDRGGNPVYVINGQDGTIGSSANNVVRVRVTRSVSQEWHLEIDLTGQGQSYVSQGTATDATYTRSGYFGLVLRYSSANSRNFYFDDFSVTDTAPPALEAAQTMSPNQLELRFNEPLARQDAVNPANYTLNGSMHPTSAALTAAGTVQLQFEQNFSSGANIISIRNLSDYYDNVLPEPIRSNFSFAPPAGLPGYNELLITEIMARETPAVGLPAQEYIELHNPTNRVLTLQGIRYSDATTSTTLPNVQLQPGEYAVVVPNSQVTNFAAFGRVIGISNFPSLNNTGELLQLRQPNGRLIFAVSYSDTWYKDNVKRNGGWSLEMIDVNNPCTGLDNWTASADPRGGTPAQPNSVATLNPDNTPPQLLSVTATAPNMLLLRFNERLDSVQAANRGRYSLSPAGVVSQAQVQGPLFTEVVLQLAAPLQELQRHTLSATGIVDCAGNLSHQPLQATFALPSAPAPGDVVINEVLFNPRTGGVDFVELVNRSNKYLNLQGWQLANVSNDSIASLRTITTTSYVLEPGQYVVLTSNPENIKMNYPAGPEETFLRMTSLPAYPDAAGTVVVLQPDSRIADRFDYNQNMHFGLLDDLDGVSLERIRLQGPTTAANFHSAASAVGYATPGYLNSQAQEQLAVASIFSVDPKIFTPDGDGLHDFTTLNYSTDQTGFMANITVFDERGREIRKLVRNELLATNGFFRWDGLREDGTKAAIGYYLLYIELFDLNGRKSVHKEKVVVGGVFN
ncbi:lamin tail domain-containing protein [Pontibacter beigongshangensis]|uniref:lamin tail domain-containing protein n=1 Tax=Pontibacter beigongshangensis TaxID=2574733 RepID=UPI001650924B|nr:lamin tail domain-containing protein [Pontibacter beigongshangensis]